MEYIEKRLDLIQSDLTYLRDKVDRLEATLRGVMWRVIGIGAGSGALGLMVALYVNKML